VPAAQYPVAAVRRTAAPAIVAPATAPVDTVRARIYTCRIYLGTGRIRAIPILAPLPYVSAHIKKSPCIGQFQSHFMRLRIRIVVIPRILPDLAVIRIISPVKPGGGSRPAGILPFRLGREPKCTLAQLVQSLDEGLAVIPRDSFNGPVVSFEAGRITPHDRLPLRLGYLVFPYIEWLCECDLVLGFIRISTLLVTW